ncbi:hypothetical protein GCM10010124_39460 [Pilimelia terevasa]|uniref:HTH merR-type domain-containing protein n=1 Tax=Pilimelia terevasa TaxID=53372 RepID=A0A8J3FK55_9ACTN|nr:hypothetical protein GCM10010124_39460 [Pilimelia terevasa]
MEAPVMLRIGQLSARVGVSTHALRAWESRYGLLSPVRSDGGYRLYGLGDESRIRQMKALLAAGHSAAQAAAAVLAGAPAVSPAAAPAVSPAGRPAPADRAAVLRRRLRAALDDRSEPLAARRLAQAHRELGLGPMVADVLLPYLRELGERWSTGAITVAEEHYASNIVRGWLTAHAQGWGEGGGPMAVLACPLAEQHDIALLAFGLLLRRAGWRIRFLGAQTPLADLASFAAPTVTFVLAATRVGAFSAELGALRALSARARVALAGGGATPPLARRAGPGVQVLPPDLPAAVALLGGSAAAGTADGRGSP